MRRVLLGIYSYLEFALAALVFLPLMGWVALVAPRDIRRRGQWMRRFGRTTVRLSPLWRFRVEGPIPADRAYVVVANHQSSSDPFLLSFVPWDMRYVAKAELFRIPVIGWLLRFGADLALERGQGASVRTMMAGARETLDGGLSVMMFPEGTRSADGGVAPFKDGAFALAIAAGVPVLPVVIEGTRSCRPKGSRWFGEASAVARVLPPVASDGLDVATLRDRVRGQIVAELALMTGRQPAPAPAPTGVLAEV